LPFWELSTGERAGLFQNSRFPPRADPGRDFEFISISTDKADRLDRALEFLKKNQASNRNCIFTGESIYPLIETVDPAWQGALPYTLIVELAGKIVYRSRGMIDPLALRKFIVEHPLLGRYY